MTTPERPTPKPLVLDHPSPLTWGEGDAGRLAASVEALNPPGDVQAPATTRSMYRKLDTGGWEVELRGSGARGAGCLLIPFAVFWNGIVLLFFVGIIKDGPDPKLTPGGWVAMVAMVAVFGGVGALLAWMAWVTVGRKGSVSCDGGMMSLSEKGAFRRRRVELSLAAIESVIAEPTSMEVNDLPLVRLAVRMKGGVVHRHFLGHASEDLVWVASLLRQSLPRAR